jgi:hypothetical protein
MRSCVLLVSLLAGAIEASALTAGEQPQSKSRDADKARQLAEEKLERDAATLDACCRRILDLQTAIYSGTQKLYRIIEGHPDKKPRPEDERAALKLSESAKQCVKEAAKALDIVGETSALAFPEVFQELREDMKRVQRCLEMNDVGTATQALQQDIIDSIKAMMAALKSK